MAQKVKPENEIKNKLFEVAMVWQTIISNTDFIQCSASIYINTELNKIEACVRLNV